MFIYENFHIYLSEIAKRGEGGKKMKNFNKKGQAAMEFLMTYGWAILAAVIVIGALGSYFYFNQTGQSTAVVSAPFYAEAWKIADAGFELGIKNNGGDSVNITSVLIKNTDDTIQCTTASVPGVLASGSQIDITDINANGVNCAAGLVVDDNFKGTITVSYTRGSSSIELTSSGSISGIVVA